MVVDSHLHVFADAEEGLLAQGGQRLAGFDGVLEEVVGVLERGRIDQVLAFSTLPVELWRRFVAPRWPQGEVEDRLLKRAMSQNEWLCQATAASPALHSVVGADPTLPTTGMISHLKDLAGRFRVSGIKIHPALNFVPPDHPGYEPVYRFAADAGLPVITHGGSSAGTMYEAEVDYCAPDRFAPVLAAHPTLHLVLAHLGNPYLDATLELAASFPNLVTDLSWVLGAGLVEPDRLRELVRAIGVDRVLFGSDFPYFDPEASLDRLLEAGLSPAETAMVS